MLFSPPAKQAHIRLMSVLMSAALIAAGILASVLLPGDPSAAAQVACTPDAGYNSCAEFTYSGADQTFTLPANADATNVRVKLWGAGGGGVNYYTMNGGGGGYAQGTLNLVGVPSVTVIVGQGGQSACENGGENTGSLVPTYGGGGASGPAPDNLNFECGASGGGRSAIRAAIPSNTSASNEILTAGGGGGTNDGTGGISVQAGAGGGATGGDGTCGLLSGTFSVPNCIQAAGKGATATAGGAAGAGGVTAGASTASAPGTQFTGGRSGCADNTGAGLGTFIECGGGGGGGYFGGGGGWMIQPVSDGPGGGGSGHVDPVVSGGSTTGATNYTPATSAQTQAQYVAGIGVGGGTGTANVGVGPDILKPGGNGLVVFEFNTESLTVVKSASPSTMSAAGQQVVYSFLVTNTGGAALSNIHVTDAPFTGTGSLPVVTCPLPTLPPAPAQNSETCTATYSVTQADINAGTIHNTATATGTDPGGATITSPPSSATVTVTQTVQVNKTWIIKNPAGTVVGTYNVPSQGTDTASSLPAGFSAAPTLTGQTSPVFGTAYSGYTVGQSVSVGEGPVTVPSGCTVASQQLTTVNGTKLATAAALPYTVTLTGTPSPNAFTVTNTITCTQTLTLVKKIAYGSLPATDWILTGSGPSGSLAGPNGATGSAAATGVSVSPQVSYALAESSAAAGAQNYLPTSAGWACAAGTTSIPVSAASVMVGYGQAVTCTITNTTAKITLLKHIQGTGGLTAGQFNLTISPPSGLGAASTVIGSETATGTNTIEVKPGTTYTVSEQALSSTTAYLQLGLQESTDSGTTWTNVTGNQATAPAGTQVYYRFVNESVPAIVLPLTGGLGTDVITYWAIAILTSAAALLAWQLYRRKRRSRT